MDRLHKAIHDSTSSILPKTALTDDVEELEFVDIFTLRSDQHLVQIVLRYKEKYGMDLETALKPAVTGDYEKILLAICKWSPKRRR